MKIFTPILKTKRFAEYIFINNFKEKFNEHVFPYLEINKNLDHSDVKKYLNCLNNNFFISEIICKEFKPFNEYRDEIDELCKYSPGISFSISSIVDNNYPIDEIAMIINKFHTNGKIVSLRVPAGFELDKILQLTELLNDDDFFIIDLKEDEYISISLYSFYVNSLVTKPKKLVFTEDRKNIPASKFCDRGYNEDFTPSVIQAIKDGVFEFDGFGSYCSARNNQYEGGKHPFIGKGLLLLYSFKRNQYYSFVTKDSATTAQIYKKLPEELLNDSDAKKEVEALLSTSKVTSSIFNEYIYDGKFCSYKSILIGMSRYFEEILNNLMNVF